MMKKLWKQIWLFVILTAAFLPVGAQASSWLNCELLAKVEEVRAKSAIDSASSHAVKIRLLQNPYTCDGHGTSMMRSKGEILWVEIASEVHLKKITAGTQIKLKYEAYKGMGPNGLVESEEWSVLEIVK